MPGPEAAGSAPGVTTLAPRADGLRGFEVGFPSGARTRVLVGPGAIALLPALCAEAGLTGTGGMLCDARLYLLHKAALDAVARPFGGVLARPVQEDRKSLAEVEAMCEVLSGRGVSRDGFVIAVGGGVLTDLGGLAAALFLRGVPWVACPTTLLSQVDAGLGGKTGANLRAGKNLVGAFHQPRLLIADSALLSTLPIRERWSGLAEVVKCALLLPAHDAAGEPFLARCERTLEAAAQGDAAALAPLIEAALRIKAEVVCADEREGEPGTAATASPLLRAFLNLGHTVGHALETATAYRSFTHGEAVALGLRGAIALSRSRGLYSETDAARALSLVRRLQVGGALGAARLGPAERELALQAMTRDKKVSKGNVRFVLLRSGALPVLEVATPQEQALALDAALLP